MSERKAKYQVEQTEGDDADKVEAIVDRMMKELCTVKQASKILGVSTQQVHVLIDDGKIDATQLDDWFYVVHKPSLAKYQKTKSKRGRPPGAKN